MFISEGDSRHDLPRVTPIQLRIILGGLCITPMQLRLFLGGDYRHDAS